MFTHVTTEIILLWMAYSTKTKN